MIKEIVKQYWYPSIFSDPVYQGLFYNKWAILQRYHGVYKLFFWYSKVAFSVLDVFNESLLTEQSVGGNVVPFWYIIPTPNKYKFSSLWFDLTYDLANYLPCLRPVGKILWVYYLYLPMYLVSSTTKIVSLISTIV